MRKCSSRYGINSSMIASPYGPLFAEFTAYESSKYGVARWKVTAISRGKLAELQALQNSNPGSRSVRLRRAERCAGVPATLSVENPHGGVGVESARWSAAPRRRV